MSTIGTDIRTWLIADAAITAVVGARVFENKINQGNDDNVCIWFARATTSGEDALDDDSGTKPFRQIFDLEVISKDIADTNTVADLITAKRLHRGTFGVGKVQGVFIDDHSDDYIPRGVNSDDGWHIAAFQLDIAGYTQGA